jgi:hypothetical protein
MKKKVFFLVLSIVLIMMTWRVSGKNNKPVEPETIVVELADTTASISIPDTVFLFQQIFSVLIPDEITFCGQSVPINLFYVREAIERELITNCYLHGTTLQIIKRAYRYFPVIEPVLKKNRVPNDLKFLAVAESGLRNTVSPSKAEGFWQFLEGTGKEYGLEITKEVDERYHLEKATQAACNYMNKSFNHFKKWELVAAAYNAGNAKIDETISNQKTDNYYDMAFNQETARYVYRIIALKLILEQPTKYGFFIKQYDMYPVIPTETVMIDTAIKSLPEFALKHQTPYVVLKELNPWLRSLTLPARSEKKYEILLPQKGFMDYEKKLKHPEGDNWFNGF